MLKLFIAVVGVTATMGVVAAAAQTTNTNCILLGNQISCSSASSGGAAAGEGVPLPRQVDVGAALRQAEEIRQAQAQTELLREEEALAAQQAELNRQRAAAEAKSSALAAKLVQCSQANPTDDAAYRACMTAR